MILGNLYVTALEGGNPSQCKDPRDLCKKYISFESGVLSSFREVFHHRTRCKENQFKNERTAGEGNEIEIHSHILYC